MKVIKILIVVIVSCLLAHAASAQIPRYDTIRYAREYYDGRVALFKTESVSKGNAIFLGNSHVEYGNWKKLLGDSSVVNRGIAADNTFGVLERLEDVIKRQPAKLFVEIGINDIAQNIPIDVIAKNIDTIVERVRAGSPGTKVYVHSILPTNDNCKNEYPEVFNKNSKTDQLNARLRSNANSHGYVFVDLNKELRDKDGKLSVKYARADGLHLNREGYALWVKLMKAKKFFE